MIAGILTDPGVGGTFLSWSLYFLSGADRYYHIRSKNLLTLPINPVNDRNAHGFKPNQLTDPDAAVTIKKWISEFETIADPLHVIYFHNLRTTHASTDSLCLYTSQAAETIQSRLSKILSVSLDKSHSLYNCSLNARNLTEKLTDPTVDNYTDSEQFDDFFEYFFPGAKKNWTGGHTNDSLPIWDLRELYALNLRPFNQVSIRPNINYSKSVLDIEAFDLFQQGEYVIKEIFQYLGIPLHQDRLASWIPIYLKWQNIHSDRIIFSLQFEKIIDNILLGKDHNLTPYNLDIIREAAILHCLIYKHGLIIKSWGIEKFQNTMQLHRLLEKNTYHNIEDIYGALKT